MTKMKNGLKKAKEDQQKSVTAADRIANLEKIVASTQNMIRVMAEEMDKIQQSQIALAKRLEATLTVAGEGDLINTENVNKLLVEKQVEELRQKVEVLKENGVLVPAQELTEAGFVVGKEISETGEVVSPRTQASIKSLAAETKEKLLGKKVGDLVSFEGKLSFQVEEIYNIVQPEEKQTQLENVGA